MEKDFIVYTALNGKDGLFIFNNTPLSIILLDLIMPVVSGLEVLKEIRKISSDIKVIILTGEKNYELTRKCADLGVQGFVEKPYKTVDFLDRIKNMAGVKKNCKVLQEIWGENYENQLSSINHNVRKAIDYIRQNYHKNITREDVAAYLKITAGYLSKIFNEECGIQLNEFFVKYRIEKSQEFLLNNPHLKINDIAASIGISDLNYFCRLFKQQTGKTPGEFRRENY